MKKLKKFAALLLVGVMALALLTACGGGGGPTEEQKVLAQISQEKGVQVTNDAELRAVAERRLDESLEYNFLGYAGALKGYKDRIGNDLVVTVTARNSYKNTFLSTVLTYISQYIKTDVSGSVNQDGDWRCGQGQQRAELHWYFHPHQELLQVKIYHPFPRSVAARPPSGAFLRLNPLSHALRRASSPKGGSF